MKIYQIVAEKAGDFCGVVDYTKCLVDAFQDNKNQAEMIVVNGYGLANILKAKKQCDNNANTAIHMQYPSLGMGKSPLFCLLPIFLFRAKFFITLHEFSLFSLVRKLYMAPISLLAKGLVFTNQQEADAFCRYYPWAKKKCRVIPIGTNITATKTPDKTPAGACYFGQIAEGKGIENFLDMVAVLRDKGSDMKISVIGAIIDNTLPIVIRLKKDAVKYNINLFINKDGGKVSKLLSAHKIAVLPFPDGVTDKRGSALACLGNGLDLITVHSPLTPQWWKDVSYHFETPKAAADMILNMPAQKNDKADSILKTALHERQWPNIAERHHKIYEER